MVSSSRRPRALCFSGLLRVRRVTCSLMLNVTVSDISPPRWALVFWHKGLEPATRRSRRLQGDQTTRTERCPWCGDHADYQAYHDEEWGVPLADELRLFEFLNLEG